MDNILDYLDWRGDIPFSVSPFNEVDNYIVAKIGCCDFDGIVPAWTDAVDEALDTPLKDHCAALPALVSEQMDKLQFSQALVEIWKVIGECNKYIDLTQPWVLGKDPEKKGRRSAP